VAKQPTRQVRKLLNEPQNHGGAGLCEQYSALADRTGQRDHHIERNKIKQNKSRAIQNF
jgi:hypothetical protein